MVRTGALIAVLLLVSPEVILVRGQVNGLDPVLQIGPATSIVADGDGNVWIATRDGVKPGGSGSV